MKNDKIQTFLKLLLKANVIVLIDNQICELISFNDYFMMLKYQLFLEKKKREAYFIHLENLLSSSGDAEHYLLGLQYQFSEALSSFIEKSGFLIRKQISIKDQFENQIQFNDLTPDVKQKISSFISIQKTNLHDFLLRISPSEKSFPHTGLKWMGKKTELVELSNALFEGDLIKSQNGSITKKEFMQKFFSLFGEEIKNPEKVLSKSILRENPAQFIDKLKSIQSGFCDDK